MIGVLACFAGTPFGDLTFDHYGLATAAVTLGAVTLVTGVWLLVDRYGTAFQPPWRTVLRILHVVVGVFMTAYLIGAYLCTPV